MALEVGYQSPSAFIAAFTDAFGTTPGRYHQSARPERGRWADARRQVLPAAGALYHRRTRALRVDGRYEGAMAPNLKVLVVDDDPVSLILSQEALAALGHDVLTHDHALGTAPLVARERPDVVLIDVHMPALSGNEIVQLVGELEARGSGARTRFILHSGDSEEELARLVEQTGALGAIRKTGDAAAFQQAFQRLVAVRT